MSVPKHLMHSAMVLAVMTAACGEPSVDAELALTASPKTVDGAGQKSVIKVFATDDKGKPGSGTVRLSSTAGSLKDGAEVTLTAGEGSIDFVCDRATDANCLAQVRVTGEWVVAKKLASAFVVVTVSPPVVRPPDGGVTLSTSRTQIGLGLGATADIVATYVLDGSPVAGTALSLTSSVGTLLLPDGGPFSSPATTDTAGVVRAVLADNGTPGLAAVSASGPLGRGAAVNVRFYTPDASVSIVSDKMALTLGFQELATLTVNHTVENRAVPGRQLTLETTAGKLVTADGGLFTSPVATDVSGQVRAYLTDMGSPGTATVTVRDAVSNVQASTGILLAAPDAGVVVATSRSSLFLDINDFITVRASLFANGNPSPNRMLNVAVAPLGQLSLPDAGVFNGSGVTDSTGALNLVLRDTGTSGSTVITATDPASNRVGTANVSIRQISTVNFQQMTCSGSPCTVLGINSSNFRTAGRLRFVVRDNQTMPQPVQGATVNFTLTLSGATGTTIAPSQTVTDASGVAEVNVNTGNAVGTFTVTATVLPGVAATSPSFGIRGAKPTNRGFTMQCNRTTMSAYTAPLPPLDITANCTVTVVDRNLNPVGLATDVSLRAEAGSIAATAQTLEFSTSMSAQEGKANVDFRTVGDFPAADVGPLASDGTQYPSALALEPSRNDGLLVRNPRDGLVVIVAWTRGEEWFEDLDGNGVQNGNEAFVDQGEPFVDSNDNDIFDGNDKAFNVDGDGVYTPANGVWDANTFVWTKTYVLYTDRTSAGLSFFNPTGFNVARGANSGPIAVYMPDLNFNRVEAGSVGAFQRTATKGMIATEFNLGLDGFGFEFSPRILTNQAGNQTCPTPTNRICVYKTRFGTWDNGYIGNLTITGAALADTAPSQPESITVRVTTRAGTVTSLPLTGTIQ
jgi:hypothetical protein